MAADKTGDNGKMMAIANAAKFAPALLAWYDHAARDLPWRYSQHQNADPYRVWLSEIMLQQTQVETVKSYFAAFTSRWPTIEALAAASLDDVLSQWAGLGYYARARNLHKCATKVAREFSGKFPESATELQTLPGIGPYTAAAIAAIVHDEPIGVMDGNVERVLARLTRLKDPVAKAKPHLRTLAQSLTPQLRAGDYAQAMMDLGAVICRPKSPKCVQCPVRAFCAAHRAGDETTYPVRLQRKKIPTRRAAAFWLTVGDFVFLRRRPEKGLLGGMLEVPSSPWHEAGPGDDYLDFAPVRTNWKHRAGVVRHTFTHFHLEFDVHCAAIAEAQPLGGEWIPIPDLKDRALPTLFAKVAMHALASE